MSQASPASVAFATDEDPAAAAPASVSLKGTTRGMEIVIAGSPSVDALGARLTELLGEAPGFFAGCDARVALEGALPPGALACLEEVAARFDVHIVEIAPAARRRRRTRVPATLRPDDVPQASLAEGTGPIAETKSAGDIEPYSAIEVIEAPSAPAPVAAAPVIAAPAPAPAAAPAAAPPTTTDEASPPGPRLVIGPVRSGAIVDHAGHVIVIGDVNPGAEVRATGSIIVLGRLRGVAHAAIGRPSGCIVALSFAPQQLRIGRMVARAADKDRSSGGAEIAYATGSTIVVERFTGRLPNGLANGLASLAASM